VSEGGEEKSRGLYITDNDIALGAERVYQKAVKRRIRVRSLALSLGDLRPLGWSPDLFVPELDEKERRVQDAADKVRKRYGVDALITGAVLAASATPGKHTSPAFGFRF
jgi:DNA polymerase-4